MSKLDKKLQEFQNSLYSICGVKKQDEYGNTVLHIAAGCFDYEVVKALIEKGADVNAKNKEQRTPLYNAAFAENAGTIQALLEEGADVNAMTLFWIYSITLGKHDELQRCSNKANRRRGKC